MIRYQVAINLRPWREELKYAKQKKFNRWCLLTLLFSLLISFLIWNKLTNYLTHIKVENQLIEKHIYQLKNQTEAIINLRETHQKLIHNLTITQQLEAQRLMTHLIYSQLVEAINEDIYLTSIEREANKIKLSGKASNNQAVAEFMRNLAHQANFTAPKLTRLTTEEGTSISRFNLSLLIEETQ